MKQLTSEYISMIKGLKGKIVELSQLHETGQSSNQGRLSDLQKECIQMCSSFIEDKEELDNPDYGSSLHGNSKTRKNTMKVSYLSKISGDDVAEVQIDECYFQILNIFDIDKENKNSHLMLLKEISSLKNQVMELLEVFRMENENRRENNQLLKRILSNKYLKPEQIVEECLEALN